MSSDIDVLERFKPVLNMRAVNTLGFICLIKLVVSNEPISYTRLYELFKQSLVTTKKGTPFSNSSFYHLLEAAKVLGLIEQFKRGKSYFPSQEGKTMIQMLEKHGFDTTNTNELLSNEGKRVLRQLIKNNTTLKNAFFWLFCKLENEIPIEEGLPITIVAKNQNIKDAGQKIIKKSYAYEITSQFCKPFTLTTLYSQAVILGIRTWLIELGVLDELMVIPREGITDSEVQILFPLKETTGSNLNEFEEKMLPYFWKLAEHRANYWQVSVPALLYDLCPGEHIAVLSAKANLIEWLKENRGATSRTIFSPSVAMRAWVKKPGDYNQLLKGYLETKQGYVSHISILDEALDKGKLTHIDLGTRNLNY